MRPSSHLQALGNPFDGHGGFCAEALGEFDFRGVALGPCFQIALAPAEAAQAFAHQFFGAFLVSASAFLTVMVSADTLFHLRKEFFAKSFVPQTPAATDGFEIIRAVPGLLPPLHAAGELAASGGAVTRDAVLAEQGFRAQPEGAFGGFLQIVAEAAPGVGSEGLLRAEHFGAHWIQVDIIANGFEVAVAAAIHDEGFVTSAEEVAKEFMAAVEAAGVGGKEPFHAGDEVGLGRGEDEVKMVWHEAPCMNLPAGFGTGFGEGFEEEVAVGVVIENGLATIAAVHDVIDSAGILNTEFSGHGGI